MNIVITITTHQWNLIREGKATAILERDIPTRFDISKDVVYLCVKTTHMVVGYLSRVTFEYWNANPWIRKSNPHVSTPPEYSDDDESQKIGKRIGVSYRWVQRFSPLRSLLIVWKFEEVYVLENPLLVRVVLPFRRRGPKRFSYTTAFLPTIIEYSHHPNFRLP